ncbi:metal-dependent transcriptional regulator [Flaviaesturariibacter aridisoli]|uniref:Transcriptional regulator MntR n=2 Tax=Flaviaesturariibacter aridisoli TaxID=2545761 RepID=A0A4V6P687_9BACT|nr:metal-dependent transcriptional regulator [Flaviaesturariibacter aridisoli]
MVPDTTTSSMEDLKSVSCAPAAAGRKTTRATRVPRIGFFYTPKVVYLGYQILLVRNTCYFWAMSHFTHHYEENYLKAIYKLQQKGGKVNNIALSRYLDLNPASVLEMVRKMNEKGLVQAQPDKSIALSRGGERRALAIIRRHRLWEVFLVDRLGYQWHEVHHLAEQLEHIDSDDLVDRLEAFLKFPLVDPHGDPIPDKNGRVPESNAVPLTEAAVGRSYVIRSFADTDDSFLDYLGKLQLRPGTRIKLLEHLEYDGSCQVQVQKVTLQLSEKVAGNILVSQP